MLFSIAIKVIKYLGNKPNKKYSRAKLKNIQNFIQGYKGRPT